MVRGDEPQEETVPGGELPVHYVDGREEIDLTFVAERLLNWASMAQALENTTFPGSSVNGVGWLGDGALVDHPAMLIATTGRTSNGR
jgi:hypothetical protein